MNVENQTRFQRQILQQIIKRGTTVRFCRAQKKRWLIDTIEKLYRQTRRAELVEEVKSCSGIKILEAD